MSNQQKSVPKSTEWQFEQLYSSAFLWTMIVPLIASYITYHGYKYFSISEALGGSWAALKPICGILAYLFLAFWLLRANYTFWYAQLSEDQSQRVFPFAERRQAPYLYFLIGNALLCAICVISMQASWLMIHLGILLLGLIFRFVSLVLNDFYHSMRYHLSYFYPSILSIVILAFVIAKQEQFGDFFLELARSPWNFFGFSLIFGVSIITVWFAPSYLYFTDHFSIDESKDKAISKQFEIWQKGFIVVLSVTTVMSRVVPGLLHYGYRYFANNRTESDLMSLLWKHKNEINNPVSYQMEPKGFTIVRIVLGLSYIATLASLAGNVWLKSFGIEWLDMSSAILLLSLLLPLTVSYLYFYAYAKKDKDDLTSFRDLLQYSWVFIFIVFLIMTIVLIVLSYLNANYYTEARLFSALFLFIATTIFTSLPLIAYGYTFQRLYYLLSSQAVPQLDVLKKYARFFTAIVLGANASVAGLSLFFLIFMWIVPFEWIYPSISEINTINIYILLVHGLIAGITLIDRFVRIRGKVKNLFPDSKPRTSNAARIWAGILIIGLPLIMYASGIGNSYHEVFYHQHETDPHISLKAYTKRYVETLQAQTDTTRPIVLVAADGGGLKAASWTMLNLYHLDSLGYYDDQVFLMAGASGGSLGEGLYTYMKAQNLNPVQIDSVIKRLSNTNFVSGDLTGVMTRWPYGMVPDFGQWPGRAQDRMEAMAETYFNIIQEIAGNADLKNNPWSYEQLREETYAYLWKDKGQLREQHLPVFITNSARAEDGVKAWAHPFEADAFIEAGAVDLSTYIDKSKEDTSYISFPDALFLTNRFPIMSPAAKIKGKGHFIDAGAVDNSGLETLVQFLSKMKAEALTGDTVFQQFFDLAEQRGIQVFSIRHSRGRYIDELFTDEVKGALEATNRKSELSAFFGAVVSAGIYGKPKVIDQIVADGEAQGLLGIDTLLEVNLPYRLEAQAVENHFFRKIDSSTFNLIKGQIRQVNATIDSVHSGKRIVEPALGRLLSRPSQIYMREMLQHPGVMDKYKVLKPSN